MAYILLVFMALVTLTRSQGGEEAKVPDCKGDIPLYLRWPNTFFYHLDSNADVNTLVSLTFPRNDDVGFREKWTAQPTGDVIRWVLTDGGASDYTREANQFSWKHEPQPIPDVGYDIKLKFMMKGVAQVDSMNDGNKLRAERGIVVPAGTASSVHQNNFTYTKPKATEQADFGIMLDVASLNMASEYQIEEVEDMQLVKETKICQHFGISLNALPCDPKQPYRTNDGSCNNLKKPNYGRAFQPFRRLLPHDYADGMTSPRKGKRGAALPNARLVSLALKEFPQQISSCYSVLQMSFGQFIDHDLTATPAFKGFNGSAITCCDQRVLQDPSLVHPECFPISIDSFDPLYSIYGKTCMEFVRSLPASRCYFGPREQVNQVTAYIDASSVYGSDKDHADSLRTFQGGLLKTTVTKEGHELLPTTKGDDDCNDEEHKRKGEFCFVSGDARVNEHILLTFLTTVFAREHNRIAKELAKGRPGISDEALFQVAKKIVTAEIQHITYNEFLSGILGNKVLQALKLKPNRGGEFFTGYSEKINAGISNEFSTAAFRMGHSMIPEHIYRKDKNGKYKFDNLNSGIFFPFSLYDTDGFYEMLHGALTQSIGQVDQSFSGQITGALFRMDIRFGLDLVALNIQRGRDHGLSGYIEARKACGYPSVSTFADLKKIFDPEMMAMLTKLYKHVEDIDLFVGGMAETPLPGALVGPTFACIIADQFVRAKRGDRFWYENKNQVGSFTSDELKTLHEVSLARVICDNFKVVDTIQRWPMQIPGLHNPVLPCSSLCFPSLDLSKFHHNFR